jgi:putative hemolysin
MIVGELLIIVLLIVVNGFFAMSELAVVSARRARLQMLAEDGHPGAKVALQLAAEPGRFLSSVQVGITLIGILAGAFGGATLAQELEHYLGTVPKLAPYANVLALGVVVVGIAYLSLILGELVPKQLALRNAERIAVIVARPMRGLAWLMAPLVYLLDISARAGLWLLGGQGGTPQIVTDEEIKTLVAEATEAGVVAHAEQAMIVSVMRLADRPVQAIMTPRPDIVWLDLDDSAEQLRHLLRESGYSRFLVGRGQIDEVLGVVQARDLLNQWLEGRPLDVAAALREAPVVHGNLGALRVLEILKQSPLAMALVVDEYGGLEGLVTVTDILEAIVGELAEHDTDSEPEIIQREDGSWLVDGSVAIDQIKELLNLRELPEEGEFHTLAGLVLQQLGHLPIASEHFAWGGYRFEVVDMDGRRIDKVLIGRLANDNEGI